MFCPQCGSSQSDDLNFCKLCGANLQTVRQVLQTPLSLGAPPAAGERFDWSKTWVAEMFMSESERKRRESELERLRGVTPEVKRYNEIKAGVIVSSIGVGVMIFLYILMQGIIASGEVKPGEAEILRRIWVSGVIPFFVGLGILVNGLWVSRKIVEASRRRDGKSLTEGEQRGGRETERLRLSEAETPAYTPSDFSVTEDETARLSRQPC